MFKMFDKSCIYLRMMDKVKTIKVQVLPKTSQILGAEDTAAVHNLVKKKPATVGDVRTLLGFLS